MRISNFHGILITILLNINICYSHSNIKTKILYGGDYDHAPYEYINSHGEPAGFHIDLMNAIGDVMGFEVEFELAPWNQIRRELEIEGKVDVSDMFYASFSENIVDFSVSHTSVYHEIIARKTGVYEDVTIAKLRGKKVIVEASSYLQKYIEQNDLGIKLILVESETAALRLLASGRHDYAIVTQYQGHDFINKYDKANLIPAGDPVFLRELALVVPEGRHDLLATLDRGVEILKDSGRYSELYVKWFGTPDQYRQEGMDMKDVLFYISWIVAPIAFIAIMIAGWSWSLKKQVNKKTNQLKDELNARNEIQKLLEVNNIELSKTNAELDQFVYVTSHDIRAPLASILGLISLIRVEPNKINYYLDLIESSIQKLDRFTSDIIDYAKNSRMEVVTESIDFEEMIRSNYENLKYLDKSERISFEVGVNSNPNFYSDKFRLNIIINNLLSNALKYHSLRRENPYIRIEVRANENECVLQVIDNGQGIENEQKEKVFDMFYRGNYDSKGAGIGLYIVKETVNKLGGKMILETTIGEGSEFTVTIPNMNKVENTIEKVNYST